MNPQMMQMAQEMMNKMTPEQMQAMMGSMGNMDPGMMQQAMQQMRNMSPADMENMRRQMGSMDPSLMASQAQQAAKQMSAQQQYKYNASMQLKSEGNRLHTAASYAEAAEKYARAKDNLSEVHTPEARDLRKACMLNLSSCYLNTGDYQQCVAECNLVLQDDPQNLKALYRRGQAHAALNHHQEAEADLQRSLQLSGHDQQQQQLIQERLRAVQAKLKEQQQQQQQQQQQESGTSGSKDTKELLEQEESEDGLIEEVPDSKPGGEDSDADMPALEEIDIPGQQQQPPEPSSTSVQHRSSPGGTAMMPGLEDMSEAQQSQMRQMAEMMKANPQMCQQAAELMRSMPASAIADMSRQAGMPVDSAAVAEMQRNMAAMSPQQMETMMKLAAGQANNPAAVAETLGKDPELLRSAAKMMQSMPKEQLQAALAQSGMPSNVDPAMLSMATDAMSKMSPDQLQQMMQMAAGLQGSRGVASTAAAAAAAPSSAGSNSSNESVAAIQNREPRVAPAAPASADVPVGDVSVMMTPEMMKMAADMMQNMKPEDMVAMQQMMKDGGVSSGAEQIMTPEMMKMAADMMKNMKPEDLAAMQQMMGPGAAAGGLPGASSAAAGGGTMPSGWADMMSKMNPQIVEDMLRSLQALDEASLAQMFKGMAGSEAQAAAMAAQVKKLSPSQLRFIGTAAGVVQGGIQKAQIARRWLSSNLVLVTCVVVLVIALLLRWSGLM